MQPSDRHKLVLCTVPDQASGENIAAELVAARLAACVNLVPGMVSIYRWQGETHKDAERLLLIKTRAECLQELEAAIKKAHPYELPEIIALPIEQGLEGYLRWIDEHTETR